MVCGLAVFEDLEIALGQVGNQPAFLVFDVEKELDNVDVDFQCADGLVPLLGLVCPGLVVRVRSAGQVGKLLGQGQRLAARAGCQPWRSPEVGLQMPATCGLSASRYSPALFVSLFHQG